MYRWQKLLGDSTARKQRLLRMQDQFRQIEELYLTFAKKASAFNSWFENAEEDLTDPVRCNSIEEIRALRDAHAQFQVRRVVGIFFSQCCTFYYTFDEHTLLHCVYNNFCRLPYPLRKQTSKLWQLLTSKLKASMWA